MKTYYTLVLPLIFLLVVASCGSLVQDVNPDRLPKSEAKLVIHGYLSPQDTVLAIKVENNKTLFGTTVTVIPDRNTNFGPISAVKDAIVTLSDGTKTINLVLDSRWSEYRAAAKLLPIVAGKTYTLKVTTPRSLVAESSCTIPAQVPIREAKQDSVAARYNSNRFDKTVRVLWQDPAGKGNYYKIEGGVNIQFIQPAQGTQPEIKYNNWNLYYFNNSGGTGDLVSDAQNDGGLLASSVGRLNNSYYYSAGSNTKIIKSVVYLVTCDKNYYDYHRAMDMYNDNPFSEPSLTPSNIKGGFGCFAGYNAAEFMLK